MFEVQTNCENKEGIGISERRSKYRLPSLKMNRQNENFGLTRLPMGNKREKMN